MGSFLFHKNKKLRQKYNTDLATSRHCNSAMITHCGKFKVVENCRTVVRMQHITTLHWNVTHLHGRHTFSETIRFNLSFGFLCTTCTLHWCIQNACTLAGNGEKMQQRRYICTYACNRHWNQITWTPAIKWLIKVYVNGLLIYNVPHMLSLSVYNWRFSVNRKWLRTAAQLLKFRTTQHSSEMWITCTGAIRLVRQLD